LPNKVIQMVEEGKLTAGQVRPLIGRFNALPMALSIIKEKLSSRSIENLVKREKEAEDNKVKINKKTDPNILLIERKIEENLGLKAKVANRKNNSGKVTVEYSNFDQFEMLSNLLTKKK